MCLQNKLHKAGHLFVQEGHWDAKEEKWSDTKQFQGELLLRDWEQTGRLDNTCITKINFQLQSVVKNKLQEQR